MLFRSAILVTIGLPTLIDFAIPWPLTLRILLAVALLVPIGVLLGIPLPGGIRMVSATHPGIIAWAWGINGAFSVVGATLAVFLAMNWGFSVTLSIAALVYGTAALTANAR